jgi:hypothetical protein
LRFSARIFLATLLLCACCLAQSRNPYESSTEDNVYTNFFFRFHYSFTASWVAQSTDAAVEQLQRAGQVHLNEDRKEDGARKAGKPYYLLTLLRNLPAHGDTSRSVAIISLVAEDVSSNPQITSGKDCVLKLAEHLKKARYTPVGEPAEMQISGRTFFRQDMKGTTSAGASVYQSVIFTLTGGYAVGFTLISPNRSMLTNMMSTLNTTQFY